MINPIIINMYREEQERGFDPSSGKYLIGNDFICYHDNDVKHTAIAVKAYPFPYQNIKELEVAHHCTVVSCIGYNRQPTYFIQSAMCLQCFGFLIHISTHR